MSKYMGVCWKCESCGAIGNTKPWKCPHCKEETCDFCFEAYGVCRECGAGLTAEKLMQMSGEGGWDWSEKILEEKEERRLK